jgi:hypothetical protein
MGFLVELRKESMTAKRDLKKRVRDRQAKTGESYTAARRHVVAAVQDAEAGSEDTDPGQTSSRSDDGTPIPVDSFADVTAMATALGLRCKILMSETLAKTLDVTRVLTALREVLLATLRDPAMDKLRALGLHGQVDPRGFERARDPRQAQFVAGVRAGLGGVSPDGRALGFHVGGVPIMCTVWRGQPTLVVSALEDVLVHTLSGLGPGTAAALKVAPTLVFEGTRHRMLKPSFVIGRHPTCDLQIKDGVISRRHAEVLRTERGWFIKDLGSTSGIHYKGMQIDNKRIEEGDVFSLGPYELCFTFRGS